MQQSMQSPALNRRRTSAARVVGAPVASREGHERPVAFHCEAEGSAHDVQLRPDPKVLHWRPCDHQQAPGAAGATGELPEPEIALRHAGEGKVVCIGAPDLTAKTEDWSRRLASGRIVGRSSARSGIHCRRAAVGPTPQ